MIGCEFGDIVLVPFPFTDQSTSKKRPAIVISSMNYHRERPDYIIMAVTSRTRSPQMLGEVIVLDAEDQAVLKAAISDVLG
jgi:mRNA interferase MazF